MQRRTFLKYAGVLPASAWLDSFDASGAAPKGKQLDLSKSRSPLTPEESVQYFLALLRAGVPAELHVFKDGQHGIAAAAMRDPENSDWPKVLARWLRASGLVQ